MIEPRPPESETPPITVMAMASSSYITPMPAWAVRFLELSTKAAIEARMPAMT